MTPLLREDPSIEENYCTVATELSKADRELIIAWCGRSTTLNRRQKHWLGARIACAACAVSLQHA
jgi:hypothetical protein